MRVTGSTGCVTRRAPGPPLRYGPQVRALLIAKACTRPPATGEGARQERWTHEQLGEAVGMSGSQAHEIPSRAAISIDEKTAIRAKAPTTPDTPPAPGRPTRREHDYTRKRYAVPVRRVEGRPRHGLQDPQPP